MTAAGPWGSDAYGYDAGGNRTSVSRTIGSATVAEAVLPAAGSNRLISVSSGGSTIRTFSHSPAGMLQTDVRGGVGYAYGYDARGRLATASINGTVVGRYGYDAFGRRSYREATQGPATIRRHDLFDGDGRLLAEHDADTGAAVREYVWLDDTPLALIDRDAGGAPRTLFIHAGHLDEPLMMTDASGVIVWEARYEPFGAATVLGGATAGMDLRLPGQELQQETGGLHQNFHRDYDPSLGRYLQPDPLGLEAGPNAFAYVDGDPLNAVDPEGLQTRATRAIGGAGSTPPSTTSQPYDWSLTPVRNGLIRLLAPRHADAIIHAIDGGSRDGDAAGEPGSTRYCPSNYDSCDRQRIREENRCTTLFHPDVGQMRRCRARAEANFQRCMRNEDPLPDWNDMHEDGWRATPPNRGHRR